MTLREARPDPWLLLEQSTDRLLGVVDTLDQKGEEIGRVGFSRDDLDDMDDLIAKARDELSTASETIRKERERYGWQS